MGRRRRALLGLAALALAACGREVVESAGQRKPYVGGEPWSVAGVRPGMDIDDVRRRFGEPQRSFGQPATGHAWEAPAVRQPFSVELDAQGRVRRVTGRALMAGTAVLLDGGASEDDVRAVLGAGERRGQRESGSFVIVTPGREVGAQLAYRNGDARFVLIVTGGQGLTGVVAEALPP